MTAILIIPRSVLQRAARLRRRMSTTAEGKRRERGGVGVEGILNPFFVEGRRERPRRGGGFNRECSLWIGEILYGP